MSTSGTKVDIDVFFNFKKNAIFFISSIGKIQDSFYKTFFYHD